MLRLLSQDMEPSNELGLAGIPAVTRRISC